MNQPKPSTLEKLKTQKEKLAARIQAAESRNKVAERKKDTRRKILVGAYYLEKLNERGKMDELKTALDKYLTRDSDRLLFELPSSNEQVLPNETMTT